MARNHKALELLLKLGANPHTIGIIPLTRLIISFETPLTVAMARDDFESAHLLLNYGANPAKSNWYGITPLHYAYKDEALAQKMKQNMESYAKMSIAALEKQYCKQPPKPSRIREQLDRIRAKFAAIFRHKKEETV